MSRHDTLHLKICIRTIKMYTFSSKVLRLFFLALCYLQVDKLIHIYIIISQCVIWEIILNLRGGEKLKEQKKEIEKYIFCDFID